MSIRGETFEMRLGLPGKGKTLLLTEFVVLPALIQGLDVYVNYWVNWIGPNLHLFQDFDDILDVRNCIVVFDEIGTILEPRAWDSEDSGVRKFFQQHRKRHIDIYGTTQHISLIAKTALIQTDTFLMCSKSFDSDFWAWFPWLVLHQQEMTLKEVKQEDSDFVPRFPYDEFEPVGMQSTAWLSKNRLLHNELNEFKIELFHHYCPLCCQRQDPIILNEDVENYVNFLDKKRIKWTAKKDRILFNCLKHKDTVLEIRQSAMYDTDYEINLPEKEVVFKPYYKALKEVPFRGSLSPAQLAKKRSLEI